MRAKRVVAEKRSPECSGYCRQCGQIHSLDALFARSHARDLMEKLDHFGRIDFQAPAESAVPACSTAFLFGPARGKMFGVLLCRDGHGNEVVLHAFSGQYNGRWQVAGWVAPLFAVEKFHQLNDPREKEIKALGRAMETHSPGSSEQMRLRYRRKACSRRLMEDIFTLYRVPNFRDHEKLLPEVFAGSGGMPTGTGDCCAPKLLAHAARNNLKPLSLAEFYYGRNNASGSCVHKQFYPPCRSRCQPILGYMLCGIGEDEQ